MKKKTEDFPPFLTLLNHLENGNLAIFDLQFQKKAQIPRIFPGTFLWLFSHPYAPQTVSECILSSVVRLLFLHR